MTSGMLLLSLLWFTACATSIPDNYPRTASTALQQYQDTSAARLFENDAAQHPGQSGVNILHSGYGAFITRLAMIELAERTLDLQYYHWDSDNTGHILAERVVRAADRGVRVRALIDDKSIIGLDNEVAALDAHPNIEIRLFNPFGRRSSWLLNVFTDFNRINHRMHNKLMVMDNAVTVIGGRNIGDHYFGVNTLSNFRDLDIIATGPLVRDASAVFDHFWNSDWSVPIAVLVDRVYTEADLRTILAKLREVIDTDSYPYPLDQDLDALRAHLVAERANLIWAPAHVVYDPPESIEPGADYTVLRDSLWRKMAAADHEILVESAYLVPGEGGVAAAQDLQERNVRIRILTNSLASIDVIAAHAGYAKYRRQLIENGVELYELRPDSRVVKELSPISANSKAGLHTKALIFDRETVFIGSFNLDYRSARINTEIGVLVESPEFAGRVADYLDEGVMPENSYRVLIDEKSGELYWLTEIGGQKVRYDNDPESGLWQRFIAGFIAMLPLETQL